MESSGAFTGLATARRQGVLPERGGATTRRSRERSAPRGSFDLRSSSPGRPRVARGDRVRRRFAPRRWTGQGSLLNLKTGARLRVDCASVRDSLAHDRLPLCLAAVMHDITERERAREQRERLEDQLRQAQRMESVGRLAGGVAHDFNNLLTVILGNLESVLAALNPADPIYQPLSDVQRAGESAASLTRQLLAFSRKQVIEPTAVNLNTLIANMEGMLRRIIGEDVALETRPAAELSQRPSGRGPARAGDRQPVGERPRRDAGRRPPGDPGRRRRGWRRDMRREPGGQAGAVRQALRSATPARACPRTPWLMRSSRSSRPRRPEPASASRWCTVRSARTADSST